MKAYLLEEMWTDSLENDISRALGYNKVAVTLSPGKAAKWVDRGGVHPGMEWPKVEPGTPRRRSVPLDVL